MSIGITLSIGAWKRELYLGGGTGQYDLFALSITIFAIGFTAAIKA